MVLTRQVATLYFDENKGDRQMHSEQHAFNPLKYRGTSNNMKLVHWPLMGGLLHLVQRAGDWAGP